MSYNKIQFLAYVLDTGFGAADGSQVYLGLADPAADILARCALMQRAMAAALPLAAPDADTLKVFMAPEFFFRGVTGAYAMPDAIGNAGPRAGAVSAVSALQAMAADPTWANWLFVFGSIVGTAGLDPAHGKQEVYNLTLIQAGGPDNAGEAGARVVLKEWLSDKDFIVRPPTVGPDVMVPLYHDAVEHMTPAEVGWFSTSDKLNCAIGSEVQRRNDDGGGIFSSCGVTFGVEICLDHAQQRLLNAQLPGAPQVQVQLVPSCGMDLRGGSVIAGPNGVIFGCDGAGYGSSAYCLSDQGPVPLTSQVSALDDGDLDVGAHLPPVPVSALFAEGVATGMIGVRPALGQADTGAAAGAIVSYAAAALPPAAPVPGQTETLIWQVAEGQIQFTLLYGGDGRLQRVLCRMLSTSCQLNRFWYVFPPTGMVTMPGIDADGGVGSVCLNLVGGSGGFDYGVWCVADLGAFQFRGIALEFPSVLDQRVPESVDMQMAEPATSASAP